MPRKKILFVIENSSYGGGEKTFSVLMKGLPPDRFEVFCAALPRGRFYEEAGAHCRFLPLDLSARFAPANIIRLAALMREHGINLAHSQGARADFYCALAAGLAGIPAVSTVAMPVEGFEVGAFRKRLYLFLNSVSERKFLRIITVADFLREFLVNCHKIPSEKVVVIPNPAIPEFQAGGERTGVTEGFALFSAGRLERQKGYDILLDALALIRRTDSALYGELKCVIAGSGSLEADLKRLAEQLGLAGKVVFAGFRNDVGALMRGADLFVLSSRSEGQPLVLLEAMASGRTVVAADLPGVKEIVSDGLNGLLFESGSAASLAEKIKAAFRDRELSAALGVAAAETARRFTAKTFVEAHSDLYSGLI